MDFLTGLLGAVGGAAEAHVQREDRLAKERAAQEEAERQRQFQLELLDKRFNNTIAVKDYEHKLRMEAQASDPLKKKQADVYAASAEKTRQQVELTKACKEGDEQACLALGRVSKSAKGSGDASKITSAAVKAAKAVCSDNLGNIDQDCFNRALAAYSTGRFAIDAEKQELNADPLDALMRRLSETKAAGGWPETDWKLDTQ